MLLAPAVCPFVTMRRLRSGFSLIELITVIAIIAVLTSAGFRLVEGAKERAAIHRARAELAVLAQLLAEYRREYGDFPQTADSPELLYRALTGRLGPTGGAINGRDLLTAVSLVRSNPEVPDGPNRLLDPWGGAYEYVYFTQQAGSAPERRGYVLFSCGARRATESRPTRMQVVPSTAGAEGGVISESPLNAKNLYASQ